MGSQYRAVIFYGSLQLKMEAEKIVQELTAERVFRNPIVTEVSPLKAFYPAEDYHREYYKRNPSKPYCQAIIAPKLSKFRAHWKSKLKTAAPSRRG